ncbi:MAG: homoserine dehydrogenase [Erysipelotrichaceae bacterium]|nr:homoserine dehydrogenase [Erysipelotrichaceae bacterium]
MNVALLGLGNVGRAVFDILSKKEADIFKNYEVNVKYVLVRNVENKGIDKSLLTTNFEDILLDESIDVVIEMMGALVSYDYMKRALLASKHVITANKEVIANHYVELQEIAMKNKVKLLFEASVGGGIPIVHTMLNSAPFNHITKIEGILNGTTNFILTSMHKEKISFEEALKLAQIKGFAEADPTADLEGLDMVRKIAILSMIAYNSQIDLNNIYHYGISNVDKEIVEVIDLLDYKLKFIASSSLGESGIDITVEPVALRKSDLLANVDYEYNLIRYHGEGCATQMMYGKGAGPTTANSIVFDLGLVLSDYRQKFMPALSLESNGNVNVKARYIMKINDDFDMSIVEKSLGKMVISKEITGDKLNEISSTISFYARIID